LKLNQNQVFFSPKIPKEGGEPSSDGFHQNDDKLLARFRKSTENLNKNNEYDTQRPLEGSSEYGLHKKQVVKMKKHNVLSALQKAILSTQFEGLKVLTKDNILGAQKLLEGETTNPPEYVPVGEDGDDENVGRFMMELGSWLQDQNQRFKITVKKKYINDILLMSKGAQNLAQNVVMVISNNSALAMNTPLKKVKRAKRNLSVDVSSGDEEQPERVEHEMHMRI